MPCEGLRALEGEEMRCSKCDLEMEQFETDPETNIVGGWYCEHCDYFIHESEIDHSDELYDI